MCNLQWAVRSWVAACLLSTGWCLFQPPSVFCNAIQDENALPGTTSWQLSNPATHREIEGYASLTSVNQGRQIRLFVNTTETNYAIDIFRMGWYGGNGGREVFGPVIRGGTKQVTPTADPV